MIFILFVFIKKINYKQKPLGQPPPNLSNWKAVLVLVLEDKSKQLLQDKEVVEKWVGLDTLVAFWFLFYFMLYHFVLFVSEKRVSLFSLFLSEKRVSLKYF